MYSAVFLLRDELILVSTELHLYYSTPCGLEPRLLFTCELFILFQYVAELRKRICLFPVLREAPTLEDFFMEIKIDNNFCSGSQGRTLPEFSDTSVSLFRIC